MRKQDAAREGRPPVTKDRPRPWVLVDEYGEQTGREVHKTYVSSCLIYYVFRTF